MAWERAQAAHACWSELVARVWLQPAFILLQIQGLAFHRRQATFFVCVARSDVRD
jgi:hypothetical protein